MRHLCQALVRSLALAERVGRERFEGDGGAVCFGGLRRSVVDLWILQEETLGTM